MKFVPWMVILSLGLVGCSGSKTAPTVSEETPQIELSDADEFVENPNDSGESSAETPSEDLADLGSETPAEESVAEVPVEAPTEEMASTETAAATEEPVPVVAESVESTGGDATYKVSKNETLMMIAFKLYGDYGRWKEIANYNSEKLNGSTVVTPGMELRYRAPAEEFVWNPQGLAYLIRTGDTLGTISNSVYLTPKKWKSIWDNNRPLIKNPNLIFSGFTIYYLENGREVAAEI